MFFQSELVINLGAVVGEVVEPQSPFQFCRKTAAKAPLIFRKAMIAIIFTYRVVMKVGHNVAIDLDYLLFTLPANLLYASAYRAMSKHFVRRRPHELVGMLVAISAGTSKFKGSYLFTSEVKAAYTAATFTKLISGSREVADVEIFSVRPVALHDVIGVPLPETVMARYSPNFHELWEEHVDPLKWPVAKSCPLHLNLSVKRGYAEVKITLARQSRVR